VKADPMVGIQVGAVSFVDERCCRPRENAGYMVNCILDAGYRSMRERAWTSVEYEQGFAHG
jgi:hypothetical protein